MSNTLSPPSKDLGLTDVVRTRMEACDQLAASLNKRLFKNAPVVVASAKRPPVDIPIISTGSLAIDAATGMGGVPRANMTEIFGPESGGKSSLTYSTIIQAQAAREDAMVLLVDGENSYFEKRFVAMGGDANRIYVVRPQFGEDQLEVGYACGESGLFDLIAYDSVEHIVPRAEIEGDAGDANMGLKSRLMGQATRRFMGILIQQPQLAIIFINQIRTDIGQRVMPGMPPKEVTPGGRALRFNSNLRIRVSRGYVKDAPTKQRLASYGRGQLIKAKIVKARFGTDIAENSSYYIYGKGFAFVEDLLVAANDLAITEKKGGYKSWSAEDGKKFTWQNLLGFESGLLADGAHFEEFKTRVMATLYKSNKPPMILPQTPRDESDDLPDETVVYTDEDIEDA